MKKKNGNKDKGSGRQENLYAIVPNIEAATILLGRLKESIIDPTPEKIGTLWNGLSKDQVSGVGARIGRAYKEKPWLDEKILQRADFYDNNGVTGGYFEHYFEIFWDHER